MAAREPTATEVFTEWRDLLLTTRHLTVPPLAAAVLAAAAAAATWWAWAWWACAALIAWVVWVGLASWLPDLPVRAVDPLPDDPPLWQTLYQGWRRYQERIAGGLALAAGAAWSAAALTLGIGVGLIAAELVLLAPMWAAWWKHRRIRLAVVVERDVAAWGDGSRVGLAGTTARALAAGTDWFQLKVSPAKGEGSRLHTHAEYRNAVERVAALFRVRARHVTMIESNEESSVTYTVRTKEREVTAPDEDLTMDRVAGAKRLGTTDAGEVVNTCHYLDGREGRGRGSQHGIAVGVTDSGKSSKMNKDCEIAARAVDELLIVWDFSYGAAELRAWADCTAWFCYTPEQAMASLRWAVAACEYRGANMRGRVHKPTKRAPAIRIVSDELASMFAPDLVARTGDAFTDASLARLEVDQRVQEWEEAIRLFRKYAVGVDGATQYAVDATMGGETAKQQLSKSRTVFRLGRDQDAIQIMPMSMCKGASEFYLPGTCRHIGPLTSEGGDQLRVDYLDDAAIARRVAAWKDHQPLPEPALQEHPLWKERNRTPPPREDDQDDEDDSGEDDELKPGDDDRVEAAPAPEPAAAAPVAVAVDEPAPAPEPDEPERRRRVRMVATDATLDALWGQLLGQEWSTSGEVASVMSYSPGYARKLLAELHAQGKVERKGKARATRYRALPRKQWQRARDLVASGSGSE